MQSLNDMTLLHVYTPWQNAEETRFSYLLGNDPQTVPDSLSDVPFIQIPVEKTVIMSTTFIGFLDTLDVGRTITGVSGGKYIYDPELEERYRTGEIREVGYDQQLNYEVLLELDPDVVFLFGVQSGIMQTVNKLKEAGIPVVICADYLEPHPLGRAEWIRFFAAFYDKQDLAASIFRNIARRYDSIAAGVATGSLHRDIPGVEKKESINDQASEAEWEDRSITQDVSGAAEADTEAQQRSVTIKPGQGAKNDTGAQKETGAQVEEYSPVQRKDQSISPESPKVMLGLPWKDTWYVAGGRSFAAKLIRDAGGRYLFSDHLHTEAKPYDIEAVFSRAVEADVWINPGIATNMGEILEHDPRFEKLDVFRNRAVFNNNKRLGRGGGNDYWESGVVRPDLILQDLVQIFSDPEVDSTDLFYYRKLK